MRETPPAITPADPSAPAAITGIAFGATCIVVSMITSPITSDVVVAAVAVAVVVVVAPATTPTLAATLTTFVFIDTVPPESEDGPVTNPIQEFPN